MPYINTRLAKKSEEKTNEQLQKSEEKMNEQLQKHADSLYCVLESEDGARIITTDAAKEYVADDSHASTKYTVHFAGDHSKATALQLDIEKRLYNKAVADQKHSAVLFTETLADVEKVSTESTPKKMKVTDVESPKQLIPILKTPTPVEKKLNTAFTEPTAVARTPLKSPYSAEKEISNLSAKPGTIAAIGLAKDSDESTKTDFMSYFKQISTGKQSTLSKSGVLLTVSKTFDSGKSVKALITVQMVDSASRVYWCFKPVLFGFLYSAASKMLKHDVPEYDNFLIFFKRTASSAKEIEMHSPDKNKLKLLTPEKHGNKVLAIPCEAPSEQLLEQRVQVIQNSINEINNNVLMQEEWMKKALSSEEMNYNASFQLAMMNDSNFWKIVKTECAVETEATLDKIYTYSGIEDIVRLFLMTGPYVKPTQWSAELKNVAFKNGIVPVDFM